ncbi:Glucose transporter type 1 isoform x4 [Fasciolopsis buskii]|uniref:Glucose transporter type 1 isoform x4 n=1 Tax=Fasciolopsis buskii TaxID=27845 RepID=A0A8E0S0R4_9TREM|nr:Glucose transporter type 1 isoform x4 [Fasciolopsis buski]
MIIVGRLMIGLACGAFTSIGPTYLYEVSPPAVRGTAGSLNQLMCVFSLVLSQLLGLKEAMNTEKLWPILLGLNAVPCVITSICLFLVPESPRYLFIVRNDAISAKRALYEIGRSREMVEFEVDEMIRELETAQQKISLPTFFRTPHLRWGLLVALVCQVGQQLSGLNGLLYYSETLFTQNGLTTDQAVYATIGLGLALFFASLASTLVMDRLGRRVLLIAGLLVSLLSLIIFTVCLVIHHSVGAQLPVYVAIAATYVFVIGFGLGPGPIPWLITAEMFTQESRDAAVSMSVAVNWLCNIVIGLVFLELLVSSFSPSLSPSF